MTDERHEDEARQEAARKHAQRLEEVLRPKVLPPDLERIRAKLQATFGDKAQSGAKKREATATTAPKMSVAAASNPQRKKTPKPQRQAGDMLNEHDVAIMLSKSVQTIRRWRLLNEGPKYYKVGANVRYKSEDVTAWLNERPTGGEHLKKRK